MVRSLASGRPETGGLPHGETGASVNDDTDISYQAAARGTPVLSSAGTQIGTLEHVLEVPEVDVFDEIVIATSAGLRFIDADYVRRITRSRIWCSIDDTRLPSCRHLRGRRYTASMRCRTQATACMTSWDACSAARTGLAKMTTPERVTPTPTACFSGVADAQLRAGMCESTWLFTAVSGRWRLSSLPSRLPSEIPADLPHPVAGSQGRAITPLAARK